MASATRGKRGQAFFRDLIAALEAMPVKRLIAGDLRKDGEVCALGALGVQRGMCLEGIDPEDPEIVGKNFGIAAPLAQEVVFMNDENFDDKSPEDRWQGIYDWAKQQLNKETANASI